MTTSIFLPKLTSDNMYKLIREIIVVHFGSVKNNRTRLLSLIGIVVSVLYVDSTTKIYMKFLFFKANTRLGTFQLSEKGHPKHIRQENLICKRSTRVKFPHVTTRTSWLSCQKKLPLTRVNTPIKPSNKAFKTIEKKNNPIQKKKEETNNQTFDLKKNYIFMVQVPEEFDLPQRPLGIHVVVKGVGYLLNGHHLIRLRIHNRTKQKGKPIKPNRLIN